MIGHFFGFTKQLERMWLEHWGGALYDQTKTAERETRLRGFIRVRGGEGRGRLFNLAKMVVALLKEVEFKVEKFMYAAKDQK